jgi:hypothetical protein
MFGPNRRFCRPIFLLLISIGWVSWPITGALARSESPPLNWQSEARLHEGLKKIAGTLSIGEQGVEFHPAKGPPRGRAGDSARRWPFVEIQTFDLVTPRRFVLTGYENRGRLRSGDRRFRFDLESPVPPAIAAGLAQRVRKPVRNGDPEPQSPSFAKLPARHRTLKGGSNGTLRFREAGIDYVTGADGESRSWRWADIQTLANPDPYHLRVAGYRETFEFILKQPLAPELFDRLWDHVYAQDLRASPGTGGMRP